MVYVYRTIEDDIDCVSDLKFNLQASMNGKKLTWIEYLAVCMG
ncbi:MAG: hypothetical protein PHV51_04910 [Methanosarcinaceae archaeon]|nr:hypothetical protein [Methanosarcinaceae archaeon]